MCESCNEPLERFQLEESVDHWLYEIEKKAKKTIKAAENTDVAPLDEDDIQAILLSHATRMLGSVDAQRVNDLDDLIIANNLHR
jgi:hypothetical protein